VLQAVDGRTDAAAVPGITGLSITTPVGQTVHPLPEGDRYLGFVVAEAATHQGVEEALRTARRRLRPSSSERLAARMLPSRARPMRWAARSRSGWPASSHAMTASTATVGASARPTPPRRGRGSSRRACAGDSHHSVVEAVHLGAEHGPLGTIDRRCSRRCALSGRESLRRRRKARVGGEKWRAWPVADLWAASSVRWITEEEGTMREDRRPIGYWLKRLDGLIEQHFERTLAGEGVTRRQWQALNPCTSGPPPRLSSPKPCSRPWSRTRGRIDG
jgi:hypothetical protein